MLILQIFLVCAWKYSCSTLFYPIFYIGCKIENKVDMRKNSSKFAFILQGKTNVS